MNMNDISNIVYDYSKSNKLFDEKIIKLLIDIILKENGLYDDINYAIINEQKSNHQSRGHVLGEYDFNKTIYIYLNEINRFINAKNDDYDFHNIIDPNSLDEYIYNNLLFLKTILHEVYHAKQISMIKNDDDNSIEKQILSYEFDYIRISPEDLKLNFIKRYLNHSKRRRIYISCYDISFMERLANYYSFSKIKDFALELDNQIIYNIYHHILRNYLLKKYYNNLQGPTILLMKRLGYINRFNNSDFYGDIANMDLYERTEYGFPITEIEYVKKKVLRK